MTNERYWIAINGPSCAISPFFTAEPSIVPVAQQYIGFLTWKEAEAAQSICLNGSPTEIREFFNGLRPDVSAGRIRVIDPENPQPWNLFG